MDPWSALGYIFLGITLGIIGQIVRIAIGLKKTYDEASQKNVNLDSLFDKKQLLISLLISSGSRSRCRLSGGIAIYWKRHYSGNHNCLNNSGVLWN